ncbi:MAG: phosphoribosylanthranilate isomerase [Armatimonadetes bacterium]|nr:phosphoribosylanthranilate isomerase [Armatimonadota bacterium]
MRIKVCGLTLIRDLRLAEWAGAEYVGFVVEAPSPRAVTATVAAMLARAARARRVYVVVDMLPDRLIELVRRQRPDAIQLHGHETPDELHQLHEALGEVEAWKALALTERRKDILVAANEYVKAGAARIVLDMRIGGRGAEASPTVDFDLAAELVRQIPVPCVVAGGLRPDTLAEAWEKVRPWALDISSGLEEAPGRKSPALMQQLRTLLLGASA